MDELELSEELNGEAFDDLLASLDPSELHFDVEASMKLQNSQQLHEQEEAGEAGVNANSVGETRAIEKKRANNRERCRKFRQRRREREQEVYRENLRLKRERAEFLDTITSLEYDIQALKGQGVLDLSKENELLKLEIKKHRVYIERVVHSVTSTPLDTVSLENSRIMMSASESAISQIVGLLYSSMNDTLWIKAKAVDVTAPNYNAVVQILPKVLYLPLGSSPTEARRVNVRTDIAAQGTTADEVASFSWLTTTNIDILQAKFQSIPHLKEFQVREVFPKRKVAENEEIQCFALYKPEGEKTLELLVVCSFKEVQVHPKAFGESDPDAPTELVKILSTTTCNVNIQTEASKAGKVERVEDLSIEGTVFRSTGEDTASVTTVCSTTTGGWLHKMQCNNMPLVDHDGGMNAYFMEMLKMQVRAFSEYATAKEADGHPFCEETREALSQSALP